MSGEFKIDGEAMQSVVAKAILEGVGEDQKNVLIEQAISYLITAPKATGYGEKPKSPLQETFDRAVFQASRAVVDTLIADEEISAMIEAGIRKAIVHEMTDNQEWLRTAIVDAISSKVGDVFRTERGW